mgnify:CR=1 FL=1|jgi:hypothetical protein
MATILGCACVSTTGQDLDAQPTSLAAAGVDAERMYTDKLSGSGRPRWTVLAWPPCSITPALVTPWLALPLIASVDRSPKLRAPSPISVTGESCCAHSAKGSTPPHRHAVPTVRNHGHSCRAGARAWTRTPSIIPRLPSRPAAAGHQAGETQCRTAGTASAPGCNGRACPRTGLYLRHWAGNGIPLSGVPTSCCTVVDGARVAMVSPRRYRWGRG